jgi:2-polyprenyl-3-methyl-5-hydroxy-6-metoxy-1,4-benzoquinol methylase
MSHNNNVMNYGWSNAEGPHSCSYIAPFILNAIEQYNPERVLDIGSGNGMLCSLIEQTNRYVCGVEYDKQGVELAKKHILLSIFIITAYRTTLQFYCHMKTENILT